MNDRTVHPVGFFRHTEQLPRQGQVCGASTDNTKMRATHVVKTQLSGVQRPPMGISVSARGIKDKEETVLATQLSVEETRS